MNKEKERTYKAAIVDMAMRKQEWLNAHPGFEVLVSFPEVIDGERVIGRMTDGIERGVIRCNTHGKALLEYMAGDLYPTIVMAKVAFEA